MCHCLLINRYIAKRLIKKTKCEICKISLKNLNTSSYGITADLVMTKSRRYLTHPDIFYSNLFIILKALEMSFTKFADSPNVFDQSCDDFFQTNSKIKFPCAEHQTSMFSDICSYYVVMKMRQYSYLPTCRIKIIKN